MQFYLVKGNPVLFSTQLSLALCQNEGNVGVLSSMSAFAEVSADITLLMPIMSEKDSSSIGEFWDIETVKKCGDILLETLVEPEDDSSTEDDEIEIDELCKRETPTMKKEFKMSTKLELSLVEPPAKEKEGQAIGSQLKLSVKVMEVEGNVLERLHQVCGGKVKVSLELYFIRNSRLHLFAGLVTNAVKIQNISRVQRGYHLVMTPTCEEKDILVTPEMQNHWETTISRRTKPMKAKCNIIISVDDDLEIFSDIVWSQNDTNRKILEGAVLSDFEIVASNGAVLNCHKCFLIVNSPVLSTMLQAGLSESRTNRLELKDMSETGVRALLTFLYYDDQTEPKKNLSVAYELLQAGHKYCISRLEQRMLKIFCNARDICFPIDLVMSLLLFLRNIAKGEPLMKKLVRIIQMDGPIDDPEYKKIFKDHLDIYPELSCDGKLNSKNKIAIN